MKRSEAYFASVVFLIGAGYLAKALTMPRGTLSRPGPGYYPIVVGALIVVLCGAFLLWGLLKGLQSDPVSAEKAAQVGQTGLARIPPSLQLAGVLALFNVALYYLGYLIAITGLLILSVRMFGYKRWWGNLLITGLTLVISYVTFVYWLAVPLPKGWIRDHLW